MENKNYYVGLDIGTNSVGYAVTYENYELCRSKGEPMWGVNLFDEASSAEKRRSFRTSRRRLDRRQMRASLIQELFALQIAQIDEGFYTRIKNSYLYPDSPSEKQRIFDTYEKQKEYTDAYPTIHHLITELMDKNSGSHDVRLVYLACAWLVAHRGHFLSEVDENNIDGVTDFGLVFKTLENHIMRDGRTLPWGECADVDKACQALQLKCGITKKVRALTDALFGKECAAPKEINDEYEYNYELVIKLLCGKNDKNKVKLNELFGKEEYAELEEPYISLGYDSDKMDSVMQSIGDDAELIVCLKQIYDWSVLVEVLRGKGTISDAKVAVYDTHKKDLITLKRFTKKYCEDKYFELFRFENEKIKNYAAYIGKNRSSGKRHSLKKSASKEDFCKYVKKLFEDITPEDADKREFDDMLLRLESNEFMPKQVDGDNRVIPYQLYLHELKKILENARRYLPFLSERDENGISVEEKIISVFKFRVPYFVGPIGNSGDKKSNHWAVRRDGRIYPWNFDDMVDMDASEKAFIDKMRGCCTYLPDEKALPKCSLVYCAFQVLNEINNIKINDSKLPVEVKQSIYNELFMKKAKVSPKNIREYLLNNGHMSESDTLSGLDITVKSSLKPYLQFKKLISSKLLSEKEVERIIEQATCSEDKARFKKWLGAEYPDLTEEDRKYIPSLKFKDFGRLSRKLLCKIGGALNPDTGEYMSIIRAMWETNYNFMQLMSDDFSYKKKIDELVAEYYGENKKSISDRLDEMYVSASVKRPILRTLDILKDIVKLQKQAPKRVFIEMARGEKEKERTKSRLERLRGLYRSIDNEDVRELQAVLDEWGDTAHNLLQSDKLFLYFIQLGRCLYTGNKIELDSIIAGDGKYNIEHIYPQSFVKDESILNNKILIDSKINGTKDNKYPIDVSIRNKMTGYWSYLKRVGLLGDEKFKRLTRNTGFTEQERFEFVNRQLVETRQSTKALATLLRELYPKTEIVYVKAQLASDFRQEFKLVKSRDINDLHHAKDAYLNIVVGNVWHMKFSKQFWRPENDNNPKTKVVFTHPVKVGNETIWQGAVDKDRVVKIAQKNTAHITMYSYCSHSGQNGGFFDQNPLPAAPGLIPLKKGMPTEKYGGYNKATVAGFVLASYTLGKKREVSFVPLKLLDMDKFLASAEYAREYVSAELGEKAKDIKVLLDGRILKINSAISLDGAIFCIRGKATSSTLGLMNMMQFNTSPEKEAYVKKLRVLCDKHKENKNIKWDERFDGVSKEENARLYDYYIEKLGAWPYNKRPGSATLLDKLSDKRDAFLSLDIFKQCEVLLQLQGIFGRIKQADLSALKESPSSGIAAVSLKLSNWKKSYTDVRIIDSSASGLFEKRSDVNLLELL